MTDHFRVLRKLNGQFRAIVLLLVSTAIVGCGLPSRVEGDQQSRVDGDWKLNTIELRFAAGIATVKGTGAVFAEYEDVSGGKLRFRRTGESNVDLIVSVVFPEEGQMIWYLGEGVNQRQIMEFTRP